MGKLEGDVVNYSSQDMAAYYAIGHFMHRWGSLEKWLELHLHHFGAGSIDRSATRVRKWAETLLEKYPANSDYHLSVGNVRDQILKIIKFRNKLYHGAIAMIADNGDIEIIYRSTKGKHENININANEIEKLAKSIDWLIGATGRLNNGEIISSLEFYERVH